MSLSPYSSLWFLSFVFYVRGVLIILMHYLEDILKHASIGGYIPPTGRVIIMSIMVSFTTVFCRALLGIPY